MSKPETPILFMKTGLEAAEPLGFYDALAQKYDADLHSTDAIRLERSPEGTISFSRRMVGVVRDEIEARTVASLTAGRSVVYDGFLNTNDRRHNIRELATAHGGLAVSLTMIAPLPLINQRLAERFDADVLAIPKELSPLDDRLQTMQKMAKQLAAGGWAHRNHDMEDETLVLDGTQTVAYLLGDVETHLEELRHREVLT